MANRENNKNVDADYYCNILFRGTPIKDKSYKEIDFAFDLKQKKKFIDNSALLLVI